MRLFNKEEVVMDAQSKPIKSAMRNRPATTSRLVNLSILEAKKKELTKQVEPVEEPEYCGSESDHLET